jgi:alkanesulfonate monooxygenase SsuD/methylene tetrahydromethanopterin reductase-like flavin-dependent oxidoreductase (luciferase family)
VTHRFRFGGSAYTTGSVWVFLDLARRTEALGYDTFLMPDHFEEKWSAVGPTLAAVAGVTSTIGVGSLV